MPKQFNKVIEDTFEIYGKEYKLIKPQSIKDLMIAFEVKRIIETYISDLMHDEDSSGGEDLLQKQENYINEYITSFGKLDSSILANNIAFLGRKYGVRVGELEEIIGVSAGYLSRTIKENSKKKISIDVVWKIAQLFNTDVNTLIGIEMWIPRTNTYLLEQFLDHLYIDTVENYYKWEFDGGMMVELHERYHEMRLITFEDDIAIYHPNHLNSELKYSLMGDIMSLKNFEGKKDLVLIPYNSDEVDSLSGYDFIFVWREENEWHWEKVFYTSDDPFGSLRERSKKLYHQIENSEFDAEVSPQIRQMVIKYINKKVIEQ